MWACTARQFKYLPNKLPYHFPSNYRSLVFHSLLFSFSSKTSYSYHSPSNYPQPKTQFLPLFYPTKHALVLGVWEMPKIGLEIRCHAKFHPTENAALNYKLHENYNYYGRRHSWTQLFVEFKERIRGDIYEPIQLACGPFKYLPNKLPNKLLMLP